MIESLTITNFRAFKAQSFNFAKLNIFVGPNNSGKSSAISALNVLAQTMGSSIIGGSPIVLNGQFDQLGTFKDLVHGGRANTPVNISFNINSYSVFLEFKYRSQRREVELSRFKLIETGKVIYEYISAKDKYDILLYGKKIESYSTTIKKREPKFNGFVPIHPEFFDFYRSISEVSAGIGPDAKESIRSADRHLAALRRMVIETFRNFDSLGPFRETPKRTYLYSGEVASHIGRNGENTVVLLSGDSSKRGGERLGFIEEITKWMKATEISDGLKVKNLTDRHFELSIVGKDGVDHNICDVGFGCSQVLPVLVAGIKHQNAKRSMYNSILVVQEPEIHLHPNAQAALGSFFASISRSKGQVFIETHSDNLILRIARHVALGDINAEDVKIFYIRDEDGVKNVSTVSIDDNGTFIPTWPGGFFPQRQSESFELARAAMGRVKQESHGQLEFQYPEFK